MRDSENQTDGDSPPERAPLPEGENFFDAWEEEFRKSYASDDKAFDF
jgi:hypothetical protein